MQIEGSIVFLYRQRGNIFPLDLLNDIYEQGDHGGRDVFFCVCQIRPGNSHGTFKSRRPDLAYAFKSPNIS